MLDVTAIVGEAWPAEIDWEGLADRAARAALALTPHAAIAGTPGIIELAVKLAEDEEVHALNAQWRGKDKPTNVLSFPMIQADLLEMIVDADGNADDGEIVLGDMILARGVCVTEAAEKGVSLADHAAHLIAHGTLHVLGYDHEGEAEAIAMEAIETRALASLGLADPYGDRGEH